MRHRIHHRKLNRTSEHRKALLRNMAQSLVEHGRISTTLPKAKAVRPYFEKLITLAVKTRRLAAEGNQAGALSARRAIHRMLGDRGLIPSGQRDTYAAMTDAVRAKTLRMPSGRRHRTGEPKGRLAFTAESVTHRLIETVAPRYQDRPGGYTRVIRLPSRRLGDASPRGCVQLVGDEEVPTSLSKPPQSARQRRVDARYGMAIRAAKRWASKERAPLEDAGPEARADTVTDPEPDANSEVDGDSGP
jgi:large subunit ribosomal protein L17